MRAVRLTDSVLGAARVKVVVCAPLVAALGLAVLALAFAPVPALGAASPARPPGPAVQRIVVIYQENHSFDNVYGSWEGVDGLADADPGHMVQTDQSGHPLGCLIQNDTELVKEPPVCGGLDAGGNPFRSHFRNRPFRLSAFVPPDADSCPDKYGPKLFGCTLDLSHDFLQSRYEVDHGRMDRFVAGNATSVGLAMGYWDTQSMPIYKYLHEPGHPRYAVADRFFQAAFGGSFLNHQWLISARTPTWPGADNQATAKQRGDDVHSVVDGNGLPSTYDRAEEFSLAYHSPLPDAEHLLYSGDLTPSCHPKPAGADTLPTPPRFIPCGDFAINTINPAQQPTSQGKRSLLPLISTRDATIADRLDAKGIGWAWYSEGWSNANGNVGAPGWTNGRRPLEHPVPGHTNCPAPYTAKDSRWPFCASVAFTFHHQPFNYYSAFSRSTSAGRRNRRQHLRDLAEFKRLLARSRVVCHLPQVTFTKLMRADSEHPGVPPYQGDTAAVGLVRAVEGSACARNTLVVFTYDEYGGAWDHMPPPGQAGGPPGPHDEWGPGPRIPAIVISPLLRHDFSVDHTEHDTTSILATIEHLYHLAPVGSRDAKAHDLFSVFAAPRGQGSIS